MRAGLVGVIIALLCSIVGYLALDRHDKNVAAERARAFNSKYFK